MPAAAYLLLPALALCAGASPTDEVTLPASKLSLHLIGRYTDGARRVVAAGPRVLKVLDLGPQMMEAVRDYKARWPRGQVVVRIYTTGSYPEGTDPREAGRHYWEEKLAPALQRLAPQDRALLDYLEGPNECEHYPVWDSVQTARWFADFWVALAPLIASAGLRPCVGSIPVGNPPGALQEIEAKLVAFAPALQVAQALGGAWSYHAYSLTYSTDVAEELWYSLRYRLLHDIIARHFPDLADMPVILTEAGIDRGGNPQQDGWQARGDVQRFQDWLHWFDERLLEDDYVLGATLFQCGDPTDWPSFEVEPITAWLADKQHR